MKLYYVDRPFMSLPEGHHFPLPKYDRLVQGVIEVGLATPDGLHAADPASLEQLLLVHTPAYVHRMTNGLMTGKEMRRIGFPWTPQLVERVLRSVGATICACRSALQDGLAANLGGGTHHAYPDHGEGYCVFNDVAVACRAMQSEGLARRIIILDCDVHQGNGTAAIFTGDPGVYTFSVHGEKNFPFHKERSSLDIPLPDGSGDAEFLEAVRRGVGQALEVFPADLVIYIAGADPFHADRLGRMKVTKPGLELRDRLVLESCRSKGLPVAIVMGGGYSRQVEDIVDIHVTTIRVAFEIEKDGPF